MQGGFFPKVVVTTTLNKKSCSSDSFKPSVASCCHAATLFRLSAGRQTARKIRSRSKSNLPLDPCWAISSLKSSADCPTQNFQITSHGGRKSDPFRMGHLSGSPQGLGIPRGGSLRWVTCGSLWWDTEVGHFVR